jgi:hypothetical protein
MAIVLNADEVKRLRGMKADRKDREALPKLSELTDKQRDALLNDLLLAAGKISAE